MEPNRRNLIQTFSSVYILSKMKDEPLPNAVETLKEFSKEWDIHILSARGFDDSFGITKDWLDKHGFPYTTIGIVREAKDKISILRSVEVDLFIDDHEIILKSLKKNKKKCLRKDMLCSCFTYSA